MHTEAVHKQEMEADVVVVGYGGAGATAAITAHDNGARVLILEKMTAGGGNTRISGGGWFTPKSMEAVQYVEALCFGTTEKEIIRTFVDTALGTKDWIQQIGGEAVSRPAYPEVFYPALRSGPYFPNVCGAEHTVRLGVKGIETEPRGELLWKLLSTNVEWRGTKVMTSTAAKELLTNEKAEVIGVMAENAGRKILVRAQRGVILTCGGFERIFQN